MFTAAAMAFPLYRVFCYYHFMAVRFEQKDEEWFEYKIVR
jgi:hypothetical protein